MNLSWTASSSPNIIAYNVYRANTSSGPFINVGSATGTSYIDTTVQAGATYFYEVTSVDSANIESVPTSPVSVAVP